MNAQAIVQLTCSTPAFAHFADTLVRSVREKMLVPDQTDDDVEAEFRALRDSFEEYFPEFCEIFASTLLRHVDEQQREGMLSALSSAPVQRYLEAATPIERELRQMLPRMTRELTEMAQAALAGAPGSVAKSASAGATKLAQLTGMLGILNGLAQGVTRNVLIERGAAADPQLLASSEARRIQSALLVTLVGFYARLFIRHVGEQHAAATVQELDQEPLRSYLRTRRAMKPELQSRMAELSARIFKKVF
jgi:hypothetical protein